MVVVVGRQGGRIPREKNHTSNLDLDFLHLLFANLKFYLFVPWEICFHRKSRKKRCKCLKGVKPNWCIANLLILSPGRKKSNDVRCKENTEGKTHKRV